MRTTNIYPPNTAGSGGSGRWYSEVRENGWLMCHGYFDSQKQAKQFIRKNKNCDISKSVLKEYAKMIRKK